MSTEHSPDSCDDLGYRHPHCRPGHALDRRGFLAHTGFGLGAMALADLLGQ